LGDTDVVICEYKQGKDWLLMSEEDHTQLLLSRCANCGKKDENLPICECKTVIFFFSKKNPLIKIGEIL